MLMVYYMMVKRGLKKLEEVPPKYIEEVRALIDAEKIVSNENNEGMDD